MYKYIFFALVLFLISVVGLLFTSSLPIYQQQVLAKGYRAIVRYDQYGIPHIRAKSQNSLYFALGYSVAKERLFNIAKKRAIATGTASQLFGQKAIQLDIFIRQVGLNRLGLELQKQIRKQDIVLYHKLQSYCQGINHFVSNSYLLPYQFYFIWSSFKRYKVSDILSIYKFVQLFLSQGLKNPVLDVKLKSKGLTDQQSKQVRPPNSSYDFQAFQQQLKKMNQHSQSRRILENRGNILIDVLTNLQIPQSLKSEVFKTGASNSWVISGQYTKSGKPILANDPHLLNQIPSVWFKAQLQLQHSNGSITKALGNLMDGFPFIMIGQNQQVAFGMTTIFADNIDLYRQEIINQTYYKVDGQLLKFKAKHKQIIQVNRGNRVQIQVLQTHRGPIITHALGQTQLVQFNASLSMAWTAYYRKGFKSLKILSKITITGQQFLKELSQLQDGPTQNVLFILKNGTIGYHASGIYPNYTAPSAYVLNGSTSKFDWHGVLPPKQNLHMIDPDKGYIVTANSKAVPKSFKYNYFDISIYTARSLRINKLLKEKIKFKNITTKQMWKMQQDTVDQSCLRARQKAALVLKEFQNFDCDFNQNSITATRFQLLLKHLTIKILSQQKVQLVRPNFAYMNLNKIPLLAKQLKQLLIKDMNFDLRYGQYKKMYYPAFGASNFIIDYFFSKRLPGRGTSDTINVAATKGITSRVGIAQANSRSVFTFNQDQQSYWSTDTGQSGHFLSPHYFDMKGSNPGIIQKGQKYFQTLIQQTTIKNIRGQKLKK